jgi:hypothetical protein
MAEATATVAMVDAPARSAILAALTIIKMQFNNELCELLPCLPIGLPGDRSL